MRVFGNNVLDKIGSPLTTTNCIIYLIKNDPVHIRNFNESISSVAMYLKKTIDSGVDLLLFVDKEFDRSTLQIPSGLNARFQTAPFENLPTGLEPHHVASYFPHPTHSNGPLGWGDPGFSIGYRNMCRFFSGAVYEQAILNGYAYYLRLDCDSKFLSDVPYNLFEYAKRNRLIYGFIADATQTDDFRVSMGFTEISRSFVRMKGSPTQVVRSFVRARRNGMYYTNLELGYVPWFQSEAYMSYYRYLDSLFGFHLYRWGDAIVKYFAVRTLLPRRSSGPLRGFIYQHGAIYPNERFLHQRISRRIRNFLKSKFNSQP